MSSGFFIFCDINKENKAFLEFINSTLTLNLYRIPKTSFPLIDFESVLQSELKYFKDDKKFTLIDKYKSFILVKNKTNVLPSTIYKRIVKLNIKFKYVARIVPMDLLTSFDPSLITNYIMATSFNGTYKILFEGRLYEKEIKERLFQIIIPLIKCKVQLNNPEFLIVVQAYKKQIGITVIKNDFLNFNLSQIHLKNHLLS